MAGIFTTTINMEHPIQQYSTTSYSSFAPRVSNPSTSSSTSSENNYYQHFDEQAQEAINMEEEGQHHQSKLEKLAAVMLKNVAYFRQF